MINKIFNEDCLVTMSRMPDNFVDLVITSPPYWNLRDYGCDEQLGLEQTYHEYLAKLVNVFQRLRSKLKASGAIWVNLGDTYSTISGNMRADFSIKSPHKNAAANKAMNIKQPKIKLKSKTLIGIPDRFKIMMIDAGWICRNDIIWHKPNAMPSSASDRFTVDYERFFFFVKQPKGYYFKQQLEPFLSSIHDINKPRNKGTENYGMNAHKGTKSPPISPGNRDWYRKGARNKRCVWSINTKSNPAAHFATFPEELIEIPMKSCCPKDGIVYDPFMGSGTTAIVAIKQGKKYIGSEISKEYCDIINKRIEQETSQGRLF